MASVEIVDYNPRWPAEFKAIAADLRDALGERALRIDHIGSTAIPGLAAKDRIDVQIAVGDFNWFGELSAQIERLGYAPRPHIVGDHCPPGWQGPGSEWAKRFFTTPPQQRPVNVHVRVLGRANQRYALLFRDYLRAHPRSAAAYAELKRRLSGNLADPATYPEVKDPACDLIMVAAEDWAAAIDWKPGPSDV